MKYKTAQDLNILGQFLGKRDIMCPRKQELKNKYNIDKADVMVLFGGSIICGGDVLADAMKNDIAEKYIIVGGAGHTTETLRIKVHEEYPEIETKDLSEAEIFSLYIKYKYSLEPDYLECNSTNCGNNITNLLDLLNENNIEFKSIILSQDATMQRRMEAVLRKYVDEDVEIINFATYEAKVIEKDNELEFEFDIPGMWDMERYITLLMGEIPRLTDDKDGYGPNGKGYIAHVDIPDEVMQAFSELKEIYGESIREANPMYGTKKNNENQ
ncbi:MAG: YdcF family protein [Clostridium sp.]|nr:YdcF family protein [Clostridium sp.]